MNEPQCNDCLDYAARYIPECCNAKDGGRVLTPSCSLRFEIYRFYGSTVAPPILSPPHDLPTEGNERNSNRSAMIIVMPTVGLAIIVIIIIGVILRMRKPKKHVESKYLLLYIVQHWMKYEAQNPYNSTLAQFELRQITRHFPSLSTTELKPSFLKWCGRQLSFESQGTKPHQFPHQFPNSWKDKRRVAP
ncbi:hypothetical protein Pyn_25424 [Prunus yedoensis var. nudiflora]|uniref:Gnk2-homologous domain-containing protein n=1 Tax=Prunus yedoensis var. nudiflora TaxID=2094558 RepID=A0A314XW06_PRUYE|nr:hypothetical protein Pyn_25424 [Prunus yedoensis var. nudiflora]